MAQDLSDTSNHELTFLESNILPNLSFLPVQPFSVSRTGNTVLWAEIWERLPGVRIYKVNLHQPVCERNSHRRILCSLFEFEESYEQLPCPTCPNEGSMLSVLRALALLPEICTQRGGGVLGQPVWRGKDGSKREGVSKR